MTLCGKEPGFFLFHIVYICIFYVGLENDWFVFTRLTKKKSILVWDATISSPLVDKLTEECDTSLFHCGVLYIQRPFAHVLQDLFD